MTKLRPQHLRRGDWQDVAEQLLGFFEAEIMAPVQAVLERATPLKVENAVGDAQLRAALLSGKIQYSRGVFSGQFSATTSQALRALGAVLDRRARVFRLAQESAPQWVRAAASDYFARAHAAHAAVQRVLDAALESVERGRYDVDARRTVKKVDEGWRRSAAKLRVKPELTEQGRDQLAENYSRNLDLYIKKWFKRDILALREDVQENAERGYRFDRLIEKVQQRRAVGKTKATFLARQETGLFMSEYRAQRFRAAGVTRYQWSTSHDSRVRPAAGLSPAERRHAGDHRALDGRVFEYARPPVVDPSTGRRGNPGQDYLCRCVDIPILD